jgi:hypothetical protein
VLTAAIYNADHVNHITNGIPAQLDDYSANAATMRLNTDPGESGTESLATSLAGELERLRYTILEMKTPLNGGVALTYWYQTASGSVAGTVAANAIGDAQLRDSAALSVIGRAANSSGDPADIVAAANGQYLCRSGDTVQFKQIQYSEIAGSQFSYNTISNLALNTFSTILTAADTTSNQFYHVFGSTFDGGFQAIVVALTNSGGLAVVSQSCTGSVTVTVSVSGTAIRVSHTHDPVADINYAILHMGAV